MTLRHLIAYAIIFACVAIAAFLILKLRRGGSRRDHQIHVDLFNSGAPDAGGSDQKSRSQPGR